MYGRTAFLTAALALLPAAPPALAATAWNNPKGGGHELTVRDMNGTESNDVSVSGPASGTWTVRDARTPLTTMQGCQSVDANTASCPAQTNFGILLMLEGGDDRASFAMDAIDGIFPAAVHGGEGNDELFTGESGQQDLSGEGGNDTLTKVGEGMEYFYGGPGDDVIRTVDTTARERRESDIVSCEDGVDTVHADASDQVAADCENVTRQEPPPGSGGGGSTAAPAPSLAEVPRRLTVSRAGAVRVPVACGASGGTCSDGRVSLRRRGRVIGRGAFDLSPGEEGDVRVGLTRAGRRALARSGALRATLVVATGGETVRRAVTLRSRAS